MADEYFKNVHKILKKKYLTQLYTFLKASCQFRFFKSDYALPCYNDS